MAVETYYGVDGLGPPVLEVDPERSGSCVPRLNVGVEIVTDVKVCGTAEGKESI